MLGLGASPEEVVRYKHMAEEEPDAEEELDAEEEVMEAQWKCHMMLIPTSGSSLLCCHTDRLSRPCRSAAPRWSCFCMGSRKLPEGACCWWTPSMSLAETAMARSGSSMRSTPRTPAGVAFLRLSEPVAASQCLCMLVGPCAHCRSHVLQWDSPKCRSEVFEPCAHCSARRPHWASCLSGT